MPVIGPKDGQARWSAGGSGSQSGFVELACVRQWTLHLTASTGSYACSGGAGWTGRIEGNHDFSGSLQFYQDSDVPLEADLREGDFGHLRLYEDADHYWLLPVVIREIRLSVDIEGAVVPVGGEILFQGTGRPTPPVWS